MDNMSVDISDTTRKIYSKPNVVEDFSEYGQIMHILCSPFEWSQDVMLIAFENMVLLVHLNFEEKLRIHELSKFMHPCRCTCLTLSPDTSLDIIPNKVIFCSGGNDFKLRVFSSDLREENTCIVLNGHNSFINDVLYDPNNTYLSSTSNDNTVKIWSTKDYTLIHTFNLTSPGVSLAWHRTDPSKLMVAEKIGLIKFFNMNMRVCIFSLDYGVPLSSAHWAPSENQLVASLNLGELIIWDLSKRCFPVYTNVLFPENGGHIRISPQGSLIAAVNDLDGCLKIVQSKNNNAILTATVILPTNIQWHYKYPVICIGDDNKLCFWKVSVK